MPSAFGVYVSHVAKWVNGAGAGRSVSQNSGHAECVPVESFDISKLTVPVRPAKSNGCLGYMANIATPPASKTPDGLSLTASRSWPLQMITSLGGETVTVPLQV
jgi:hypothetical protein